MLDSERLSAKLGKFRPSLTLELKRLTQERRAQGLPVYDFGLGETHGELAPHIREGAERAYREGQTMYGDPVGLAELRTAVLDWLGLSAHYGIENVVITSGAKQSLFNIFLALCNPADCVIFDAAPWVSYQPLAVAAYAFPVMGLPKEGEPAASDHRRLKVTGEDLRRNLRMRPHARLFLLNNPCNPTAQLYDAAEVEELLAICVEHRVYFVLDRLYWRLLFDGRSYPEPRVDSETLPWLIQVDGMSKNFRRTGGLRIGWSVAPTDVASAMGNLQSHYTSGPSSPAQFAALAALRRPYSNNLRDDLERKRDLLHREAVDLPLVDVWPTPATFYSFWDVRACFGLETPGGQVLESSDDVARYLFDRAGVVTASGGAFMQDGYLRLSFASSDEDIVGGVRAAARALRELTPSSREIAAR
ncbi:MAG TPA: aminotransferase class I/II-fold pyridoxal phosphate-dependent enzyme [Thermoanaerobaculia bacterium]|nr:aminotransferase class I/II-fold pyridoxal phosphate-dependent enzyme [Thermoanaerobaculia bacterium]